MRSPGQHRGQNDQGNPGSLPLSPVLMMLEMGCRAHGCRSSYCRITRRVTFWIQDRSKATGTHLCSMAAFNQGTIKNMCMCVCRHVCTRVCVCVQVSVHMYVDVCASVCADVHVECMQKCVCMCTCVGGHMCAHVCVQARVQVYMCTCVCVRVLGKGRELKGNR